MSKSRCQSSIRRRFTATGSAVVLGTGTLAAAATMFLGAGLVGAGTASACNQFIEPGNPYTDTCGIQGGSPTAIGGSPTAGAIIACRNIPGCLSQAVNGPGLVRVPQVDTRVRQSQ